MAEETIKLPLELKTRIKDALEPMHPEKVVLFGSRAWGQPTADSDIDLYVVTRDDFMPTTWRQKRDIVRAVARDGISALDRPAQDYMTRAVVTCGQQETIHDVMQKMTAGRFRHLPVLEDDKLIGIVSIGDVVKRRIADVEQEARDMRDYIATA